MTKIEPVALFLHDKHAGYTQLGEWDTEIGGVTHISKNEWYADAVPLYTEAQMRQLGEACAVAAWSAGMSLHKGQPNARDIGSKCAAEIRNSIKEML